MNYLTTILDNEESAVTIFTGEKMDKVLEQIKKEVESFVPDTSTPKGRKEIASLAHKVAKSKVVLDNAKKALTAEWKAKSKKVDESGKKAKVFLENLKEQVRKPLTEWEEHEKLKSEQARIKVEIEEAQIEALSMNDLFNREKVIAEKERLATEKEAEELRFKEEARIAAENLEREQLLKEQAAEQARLKAEQEAQAKIDKAKRLEAEAKANEERAKREAIEAENKAKRDAEQAETDRLQAIEDARVAQENAVLEAQEQAKLEADRIEQNRLNVIAEEKRQAEILLADKAHTSDVKNGIYRWLKSVGIEKGLAQKVVTGIANNEAPHLKINY